MSVASVFLRSQMARQSFKGRGLMVEPYEALMSTCRSRLPTEMLRASVPLLPRDVAHGCGSMPCRQEGCAMATMAVDRSDDVPPSPAIP
jgi:hypothetical protein